jgi:hypothetical protein
LIPIRTSTKGLPSGHTSEQRRAYVARLAREMLAHRIAVIWLDDPGIRPDKAAEIEREARKFIERRPGL